MSLENLAFARTDWQAMKPEKSNQPSPPPSSSPAYDPDSLIDNAICAFKMWWNHSCYESAIVSKKCVGFKVVNGKKWTVPLHRKP